MGTFEERYNAVHDEGQLLHSRESLIGQIKKFQPTEKIVPETYFVPKNYDLSDVLPSPKSGYKKPVTSLTVITYTIGWGGFAQEVINLINSCKSDAKIRIAFRPQYTSSSFLIKILNTVFNTRSTITIDLLLLSDNHIKFLHVDDMYLIGSMNLSSTADGIESSIENPNHKQNFRNNELVSIFKSGGTEMSDFLWDELSHSQHKFFIQITKDDFKSKLTNVSLMLERPVENLYLSSIGSSVLVDKLQMLFDILERELKSGEKCFVYKAEHFEYFIDLMIEFLKYPLLKGMSTEKSVITLEIDIEKSWNINIGELSEISEPDFVQIKKDILSECIEIEAPAGELGVNGKAVFKDRCESATEQFSADIKKAKIRFKDNIVEGISDLVFHYEYEKNE